MYPRRHFVWLNESDKSVSNASVAQRKTFAL